MEQFPKLSTHIRSVAHSVEGNVAHAGLHEASFVSHIHVASPAHANCIESDGHPGTHVPLVAVWQAEDDVLVQPPAAALLQLKPHCPPVERTHPGDDWH